MAFNSFFLSVFTSLKSRVPTDRNVLVESLPARTGGSSCTSSVNGGIGK